MSDIFREVEEDVRKERLEKLWKAYGDYAIALVALIILAVAGYELWLRYENSQRAKASAEFVTAQHVNNAAQVVASFDSLQDRAGRLWRARQAGRGRCHAGRRTGQRRHRAL